MTAVAIRILVAKQYGCKARHQQHHLASTILAIPVALVNFLPIINQGSITIKAIPGLAPS